MTMSVTVTNTSNWDNEPVIIDGKLLKPGESVVIGVHHSQAKAICVEPKVDFDTDPPIPFADPEGTNKQVFPNVKTVWRKGVADMVGTKFTPKDPSE